MNPIETLRGKLNIEMQNILVTAKREIMSWFIRSLTQRKWWICIGVWSLLCPSVLKHQLLLKIVKIYTNNCSKLLKVPLYSINMIALSWVLVFNDFAVNYWISEKSRLYIDCFFYCMVFFSFCRASLVKACSPACRREVLPSPKMCEMPYLLRSHFSWAGSLLTLGGACC